jgi:hypothetical protein
MRAGHNLARKISATHKDAIMSNEQYPDILKKHLTGTTPATREYDAYGPVPTDAEIAAINAAATEFLAGNEFRVVSSIFNDSVFDGFPDIARIREAFTPGTLLRVE